MIISVVFLYAVMGWRYIAIACLSTFNQLKAVWAIQPITWNADNDYDYTTSNPTQETSHEYAEGKNESREH
jgi:hypothetical protein